MTDWTPEEDEAFNEVEKNSNLGKPAPVQFKCTVVDDQHPNGVPLEQWGTPPAAQPAPEDYTALEQALTRLQKRYGELEAKVAAQPAPVQVSPTDFVDMVLDKENAIGKPIFWAEWPNKEKT